MKKIILPLLLYLYSSHSYAGYSNCDAVYKENSLRGAIKNFKISKVIKINDNHYDLKLKVNGTIRQKLDNFPTSSTHTLIDVNCASKDKEKQLKKLLKL